MSRTELYIIKNNGKPELYKEFHNSHRGAMILWSHIYNKYLKKEENYPFDIPKSRYKYMHVLLDEKPNTFWRLDVDKRLPRELRLMLASTYDRMVIKKENLPKFIEAIKKIVDIKFFVDMGHWEVYPEVFQEIYEMKGVFGICWNQTSVNADCFWEYEKDDKGNYKTVKNYNFLTGKNHQYLFEYLKGMEKKYETNHNELP